MNTPIQPLSCERVSPRELLALSLDERNAILAVQAELAIELYRQPGDLMEFEAYGEGDLYVDSSNTETR